MKKTRLLALDLDGTLLDDHKRVPAANREALQQAAARGVLIAIASGRMIPRIEPIEEALGLECDLIAYNGGKIVGPGRRGRPTISHRPLPAAVAEVFIHFSRAHGYLLNVYHEDRLFAEDGPGRRPFMEIYSSRTGARYEVEPDLSRFLGLEPTKLILLAAPAERDRLHDEFRARLAGQASVTKSDPEYLEIMAPGVDKGSALRLLAQHHGIEPEAIAAIGDAENDIEMLETAGLGVAMANAGASVKAAADKVTGRTNNEAGVAEAVWKWVLAEGP